MRPTHNSMWGMPQNNNHTWTCSSSFEELGINIAMNSTNTVNSVNILWSYGFTMMSFIIYGLLGYGLAHCLAVVLIHRNRILGILGDMRDRYIYYMSYYRRRKTFNSNIISHTTKEPLNFNSRRVFVVDNLPAYTTVKTLKNFFNWNKKDFFDEVIEIAAAPSNKSKRTALISLPAEKTESSGILECHKRSFKGNPLKITEIKNRKHAFTKNLQWICKKPLSFANSIQPTDVSCNLWKDQHSNEFSLIDAGSFMIYKRGHKVIEEAIQHALKAGIEKIVLRCSNMKEGYKAARLCEKHPGYLYFTAGIDSEDVNDKWEEELESLERLVQHSQCVAVGEIGLNFNAENLNKTEQIKAFRAQIELACRLKKTICVSFLGVGNEGVSILKEYKKDLPSCSVLDYSCEYKHKPELWRYLDLGCYITIMGSAWHSDRSSDWLVKMLKNDEIPLDRIVMESRMAWNETEKEYKTLNEFKDAFVDPQDTINLTEANFALANSCVEFDTYDERRLPFTLELAASAVNCPTVKLATIFNDNAQRLFKLNSVQ